MDRQCCGPYFLVGMGAAVWVVVRRCGWWWGWWGGWWCGGVGGGVAVWVVVGLLCIIAFRFQHVHYDIIIMRE